MQNGIMIPEDEEGQGKIDSETVTKQCSASKLLVEELDKNKTQMEEDGEEQISRAVKSLEGLKKKKKRGQLQQDLDTKKRTVADQLSDERKNMRALQLQVLRSLKPKQTMKIDKFFEALDDYAVHDAELLDRMREVNPCVPGPLRSTDKKKFTFILLKTLVEEYLVKSPKKVLELPCMTDEFLDIVLDGAINDGTMDYIMALAQGLGLPSMSEVKSKAYDSLVSVKRKMFSSSHGWEKPRGPGSSNNCNGED